MTMAKWCEGWADIDFDPAMKKANGKDPAQRRPAMAKRGLCIHSSLGGNGWKIAHVGSGMAFPGLVFIDQAMAKEFVEEVLPLIDWTSEVERTLLWKKDLELSERLRNIVNDFGDRDDLLRGFEEEAG